MKKKLNIIREAITSTSLIYYTDKIVEDLRKEAMKKFPEFLSTEISGFNLFSFGNSFLAILLHVAYSISRQGDPKHSYLQSLAVDIPFALE